MNDNLIVYLRPYKYRYNDEVRFEINNFPKKIDVKCVEIFDYLYKNQSNLFKNSNNFKKKIFSFKNLNQIKIFFQKISKKYKRVFLLNFLPLDNIKCLKIKKLIYDHKKNSNFFILELDNSGFPDKMIKKNILLKIIKFGSLKNIYFKLINFIFDLYLSELRPNYYLVAGYKKKLKYKDFNKKKIIDFNTWDNSNLKFSNHKSLKKNHIVLVDGAGPYTVSDREFLGRRHFLTNEIWYRDLNLFFSKLEKYFRCKIIIANHPNTEFNGYPKHFYGRRAITGKTLELIKYSKFIITRQSTALSHALYFKKPILLIYSDENKQDFYDISILNNISKAIASQKININEKINFKKLKKNLEINYSLYNSYLKQYISCRKDKLTNSMILSNLILHDKKKQS